MAHIEVKRRGMRPEEYTSLRYSWLKRNLYIDKIEITGFKIREAVKISEDEYRFYDDSPRPLNKGDMYFTPDGTAFIECYTTVPKKLEGEEVRFLLSTSSEMTVKINGKYIGGIDPNRESVIITPYVDSPNLHIEIMAYNRSKPDDERNPETYKKRGCRQIFEGAYLAVVNKYVESLLYDLELLIDILENECFDENYRDLVNAELDKALKLINFDDILESNKVDNSEIKAASHYIKEHIYGDKRFKSSGKVALVAHSHLDIAYYWRRIHSIDKNMRTVLIQMRLMDKYPEFRYAHSQSYTYETLEKYYPEVFNELKEKISSGRFEPVGAMYVEPDCNIPSPESLIRQCLYGQNYYKEKFGITVDTCWLPDVFGNSWILPQILKKSGVKYFVSNKMSTWNDTNRFPHNNFIWKGIDGSEIYACVPPTHFISWNAPHQIKNNWDAFIDKDTNTETIQMFGYGDGGSGVTEDMIELMRRFKEVSAMPETEHTTAKEYLGRNFNESKNLPKWDGELYLEMHRGTFTTKSEIKRLNRLLENKFRNAEIVSSCRAITDYSKNGSVTPKIIKYYNSDKIESLYKKLLVNQFHDILPGSHIAPVTADALKDYDEINKGLDEILNENGDVYFNTLGFKRRLVTFIEDKNGDVLRLGRKGYYATPGISPYKSSKIAVPVHDKNWITIDDIIETPFYKIKFENDGSILSIYDKELRREFVKGCFNKLKLYYDYPGVYDAWDIPSDYKDREETVEISENLRLTFLNGETAEFTAILKTAKSVWKMIVRLFRESRVIEVENSVDWHEKHRLAKVLFCPDILTRELVCDLGAGFIKRETHKNTTWQRARFEVLCHKWFDLSETGAGVAVINNGKYGVGLDEDGASLSLLRSTERPDPEADIGRHEFSYLIYPHKGDFLESSVNDLSLEYNVPLVRAPINMDFDFGELFLECMKLSEDKKDIIIRLSEQNGKRGTIDFPEIVTVCDLMENPAYESKEIEYRPFEIITLRFSFDYFKNYGISF